MKQKYYKGFTQISKVLPDRIKEYKLEKSFYKHQAIRFWNDAASSFIGGVKEIAKAVDFRNGVLVVACLSKEVAYQIKLLTGRIVEEINRLIGKTVVYTIFVEC